ncbi:MFS transporter [Brevibacillus fluminis]|uniref:MFS transporter n=1 Tax=Brevibacillus fluminis TaxID=511487 RepID=A0A3M8DFW5_9BACL|nr:MFS transporter [Brevibacillus fluminis]RNB86886.1 MFS transporter [Brevibacillus fluminis]
MNFRVYMLAIASFVVGMVELIIGGILDQVASQFGISISQAGELITVFSLVFAIASPILLTLTAKIERKALCLWALLVFLFGNIVAYFSPVFSMLMISRIISAASGSLLIILCVTMASSLVKEEFRARAIGVIFMGVSASLVLGIPIGLVIGTHFGWRVIFLLIAILTLLTMLGIYSFMDKMEPKPVIPLRQQLRTLKNAKMLSAQLTSLFFLTGHLTLYAYLTPFLQSTLHINATWISLFYFLFGISAVLGGGIGGWTADKWGSKKSILVIVSLFTLILFLLPTVTFSMPLFILVMMIWSALSWALTPAQQSYLIETSPETSDIQQGLNNSALHLGIALGSSIGGFVINEYSVSHNAVVGGLITLLALFCAWFSITRTSPSNAREHASLRN